MAPSTICVCASSKFDATRTTFIFRISNPVFFLAFLTYRWVETPFKRRNIVSRKAFLLFWLAGSLAFIEIGVAGHLTAGFSDRDFAQRFTQTAIQPILTADFVSQIEQNSVAQLINPDAIVQIPLDTVGTEFSPEWELAAGFGLGPTCDGAAITTPDCRTHDKPEILVWGDSFAMQLTPGILASNPDARLIQMTKSVCGPFFDVAPIAEPNYPVSGPGLFVFQSKNSRMVEAKSGEICGFVVTLYSISGKG